MKRGRSRLRIGAKVRMGGKTFRITRATAKGKKYKAVPHLRKGAVLQFRGQRLHYGSRYSKRR